ncbi:MAG: hypothetical protein D6690_17660 [Nitrospirae bacterium]|nr:MAG: hypothetical protein D6690_17660 [Nitrospirota bacterium]
MVSRIHTDATALTVIVPRTWSALAPFIRNDVKLALTCVANANHLAVAWITTNTRTESRTH